MNEWCRPIGEEGKKEGDRENEREEKHRGSERVRALEGSLCVCQ